MTPMNGVNWKVWSDPIASGGTKGRDAVGSSMRSSENEILQIWGTVGDSGEGNGPVVSCLAPGQCKAKGAAGRAPLKEIGSLGVGDGEFKGQGQRKSHIERDGCRGKDVAGGGGCRGRGRIQDGAGNQGLWDPGLDHRLEEYPKLPSSHEPRGRPC